MKATTCQGVELKKEEDSTTNTQLLPNWWVGNRAKSDNKRPRTRYQRVWSFELEQIDKALELVGGSFLAAAKLVDMSPQRFRNIVNYYPALKSKWGKKRGKQTPLPVRIRF